VEVEAFRRLCQKLVDNGNDESSQASSRYISFVSTETTKPKIFPDLLSLESLDKSTIQQVERRGKLLRLQLVKSSITTNKNNTGDVENVIH